MYLGTAYITNIIIIVRMGFVRNINSYCTWLICCGRFYKNTVRSTFAALEHSYTTFAAHSQHRSTLSLMVLIICLVLGKKGESYSINLWCINTARCDGTIYDTGILIKIRGSQHARSTLTQSQHLRSTPQSGFHQCEGASIESIHRDASLCEISASNSQYSQSYVDLKFDLAFSRVGSEWTEAAL